MRNLGKQEELMADGGFDFKKLIDDSKAVLMTPKEYFASMPKTGGYVEPLIKAVIYGLIAGILTFIWSLLHLTPAAGILGKWMGGGTVGVMSIVTAVIGAAIGLFIGGVILLIISAICGGSKDYEANVRVTAALMVLSPINALLSFTGGISIYLGAIISLAVSLYGIWLLYNALIHALGAGEKAAKVVSIILAILPVISLISMLTCYKAASTVSDKYMKDAKQQEEALKNFNKLMEEMKKQQEKQ
jgi:hypothetical protein